MSARRKQTRVRLAGLGEFNREISRLARQAGYESRDLADIAARIGMRALMRNTQPFGLGGKARKQGVRSVEIDLARIFRPVKRPGPGVISSLSDAAAWHRTQRAGSGKGRVPRTRANRRPVLGSVLSVYQGMMVERVGSAKGAWLAGAQRVGLRGVQKWITRHDGKGTAERRGRSKRALWHLHAQPAHVAAGHVLGESGARRALRAQERNVKKFFQMEIKKLAKRAEKKLNR
jgi:hypothetical protein